MKRNKNKGFTQIPNKWIFDKKISDGQFRTLVTVKSYGFGNNDAFPSQLTVARDLGKERETINRHISELEKAGYLSKRKRGYSQSNKYSFNSDEYVTNKSNSDGNITSNVTKRSHQVLADKYTNNKTNKKKKKKQTLEYEKSRKAAKLAREKLKKAGIINKQGK